MTSVPSKISEVGDQSSAASDGGENPTTVDEQRLKMGVTRSTHLIDSIPSELLSLVLELGYFDSTGARYPNTEFRTRLLQTSHRFRDITLHTPSVWSLIHLSNRNVTREIYYLPDHLKRSKDYPLDIKLVSVYGKTVNDVMDLLVPHSKRWQRVSVTVVNNDSDILPFLRHIPLPILEGLDIDCRFESSPDLISSLTFDIYPPRLSHLCLRNIYLQNVGISFQGLKVVEIRGYHGWSQVPQFKVLANSNLLESLILHVPEDKLSQPLLHSLSGRNFEITLPALRTFLLYTSQSLSANTVAFIHCFSCPRLQLLIIWEGISRTLMTYAEDADICYRLTSPSFFHPPARLMFAGVPNSLLIQSGNILAALKTLSAKMLTSLETVVVDFGPTSNVSSSFNPQDYMDEPLGPPLPALRSLIFKNITLSQLKTIAAPFMRHSHQYPNLTSLQLVNMPEIVPTNPSHYSYFTLVEGFPHLRRLTLNGVSSNAFIQQLLPKASPLIGTNSHIDTVSLPWPDFEVLSVCNDAYVSRPLLHRVISARERMGKPILKLVLDHHFSSNMESWNWMKEHAEIVEAGTRSL